MASLTRIILGIRQTEKAVRLADRYRQYVLEVEPAANKPEIKRAVESMFKVNVTSVQTQNREGKWRRLTKAWGRRAGGKCAIVTVAKGQKIEVK